MGGDTKQQAPPRRCLREARGPPHKLSHLGGQGTPQERKGRVVGRGTKGSSTGGGPGDAPRWKEAGGGWGRPPPKALREGRRLRVEARFLLRRGHSITGPGGGQGWD